MNLKLSAIVTLALYAFSSSAMALTTIECDGSGKSLKIEFTQNQSGKVLVPVKFGNTDMMSDLSQKMEVDVTILPAGSFYSDKEVRSYIGYYTTSDLKIGFDASQVFDSTGKMVRQLKNVFGMNQQRVGTCKVSQSE